MMMDAQESSPSHPFQHQDDDSDAAYEHKDSTFDSSDNESDFFADIYDEEEWSKLNKSSDQEDPPNNNMVDLSAVFPVGGMRRVSSCYFSICSNLSSDENANERIESPFPSVEEDRTTTATTADFLYHDILMNVFTYLDAASLASFSETGKRPNFECFYFLELQLQRGLLRGIAMRSREGDGDVVSERSMRRRVDDGGLLFISGTGAISRLASMDEPKAREIVQTYLDSNSSIRAMPLSHSLAYIRQLLRQHGLPNMKMRMPQPPAVPAIDDIMPAKNARNMALLFTFLGAASYMHGATPEMPDPSEVINAENVAALRDALLKMGLAGGVLKTMKEAAAKTVSASSNPSGGNNTGNSEDGTTLETRPRQSSMGGIEDLSQMLPAALTSRLYNAFSPSSSNVASLNHMDQKEEVDSDQREETLIPPERQHRSKRSHSAARLPDAADRKEIDLKPRSSSTPLISTLAEINLEQYQAPKNPLTPDAIAKAIKNPVSSNPYDHPSSSIAVDRDLSSASNLFTFTANHHIDGKIDSSLDSGEAPSGCIGAYARAVKNAAAHVTRLVKQQRKSKFEALDVEEQMQLGIRFIDACSSDVKLPIVKEILHCMDVDRFFVGPDDTETCALHAAAFNGAEQVLEFLSGGIDEYDSGLDTGLCDVNVRDANGWTALHFAAGANSVSSVRILAEHGAKLTIEASNGYTPYHWAERLSNEEVAQELQRLGADNRFVGRWVFGSSSSARSAEPFVSFLANRFFGNNR